MWQYIFLIVHLRTMDETEMNGLESYLWSLVVNLADGDTSWFPQRKALALHKEAEENNELQTLLQQVFCCLLCLLCLCVCLFTRLIDSLFGSGHGAASGAACYPTELGRYQRQLGRDQTNPAPTVCRSGWL